MATLDELVQRLLSTHGVRVSPRDPVLMLYTLMTHLGEEQAAGVRALVEEWRREMAAQTAILQALLEAVQREGVGEMREAVAQWRRDSLEVAERTLNAALAAAGTEARESLSGVAAEVAAEMGAQGER